MKFSRSMYLGPLHVRWNFCSISSRKTRVIGVQSQNYYIANWFIWKTAAVVRISTSLLGVCMSDACGVYTRSWARCYQLNCKMSWTFSCKIGFCTQTGAKTAGVTISNVSFGGWYHVPTWVFPKNNVIFVIITPKLPTFQVFVAFAAIRNFLRFPDGSQIPRWQPETRDTDWTKDQLDVDRGSWIVKKCQMTNPVSFKIWYRFF